MRFPCITVSYHSLYNVYHLIADMRSKNTYTVKDVKDGEYCILITSSP